MKVVNPPKLIGRNRIYKDVIDTISGLVDFDIRNKNRKHTIVLYRSCCAFILYKQFKLSCVEIALLLNQDHTTVLHSINVTSKKEEFSPAYEKCMYVVNHLIILYNKQHKEYKNQNEKKLHTIKKRFYKGDYKDFYSRIMRVVNNYFDVDVKIKKRNHPDYVKARKIFTRIVSDEVDINPKLIAKDLKIDRTTVIYQCKTCKALIESGFLYEDYESICKILFIPVRYRPKIGIKETIIEPENKETPLVRLKGDYSNKKHIDYDAPIEYEHN